LQVVVDTGQLNFLISYECSQGLKVCFSSHYVGVIVSGPFYGKEILRRLCKVKELFPHRKGYDCVILPMEDKLGDGNATDLYTVIIMGR